MADIRRIDDRISVAPQIFPQELSEIAALGFKGVVNNRPDDEEPGQPSDADMRAAAAAAGLSYTSIPITHAGFSHPQIDAMVQALDAADGPVLAYCRSGTRSCNLWALATATQGGDPQAITDKGAGAGYNLSGIRPMLDALSEQA
jgi:uncharacterized protein (TIGR01244 family)